LHFIIARAHKSVVIGEETGKEEELPKIPQIKNNTQESK
jgi:hypothetical protein